MVQFLQYQAEEMMLVLNELRAFLKNIYKLNSLPHTFIFNLKKQLILNILVGATLFKLAK